MSYTKTTNFSAKDSLESGDPNKIVKGSEINTEFNNIQSAISTLTSTVNGLPSVPSGIFNSVNTVSSGAMLTNPSAWSPYQTAPNPGFVVVYNSNNTSSTGIGIAANGGQARAYNPSNSNSNIQYFKVGFGTN